ncbi:glycosyltransferase [Chryseobacterium sp. M5]|uniref:glycosyltransferase n=1 Tax=Chryseobacterium sp. M5 TaxID=3379128 RepID=UPI003857E412
MEDKNKIIFIGGIFDPYNEKYVLNSSKGVIQNAADALQKSIIKGISRFYDDFFILNLPFVGSFPSLFKDFYFKIPNSYYNGVFVKNISFCNLKGYKIFSRFINTLIAIKKENNSVFVIYSINISFLLAVFLKKMSNRNNKIILIVPDLPEFMNSKNSYLKKKILYLQNLFLSKIIYPKIDGFVLLTEGMNKRLRVNENKVIIIEGIFSNDIIKKELITEEKFKILYTGTLAKRYGIIDLVEQFHKIVGKDFELLICGAGDGAEEIIEYTNKDSRIKLLGQLPRKDILNLQREVSLLVNPRKPEEFTKFSFPSKTMEYFASGTPVLMYKLEGIPTEYFDYCYTLELSDKDNLSTKIISIKEKSIIERNKLGLMAQEFIFNNKTEDKQVKKLFDYIKSLYENSK